MSDQMTLNPTHSATSLPESAGGQLPCDLRCGQTIDLFGQEAVPASRSARREKEKAKQTSATCGRCGSALSVNPDRQLCLESKCQPLYATVGGMMWPMIWKEKVTPRGRKLGQLVVSVRPTSGTDYGLWPTPRLNGQGDTAKSENRTGNRHAGDDLATAALKATMWPTPQARDFRSGEAHRATDPNRSNNLNDFAAMAMWPTPTSRDHKDGSFTPNVPVNGLLGRMVWSGSNVQTESGGQLNPAFVCWLMGYSTAHLSSMLSAMQSFRKSRRRLSRQQKDRIEA